MAKPDISIAEFRSGIKALAASIGIKARFYSSINDHAGPAFSTALYANDITGRSELDFRVDADSFRDLLAAAAAKWAEHSGKHEQRTIRKMALEIIRITADIGHCTDAALRNCGEFDPGQVRQYGERACVEANEIAGKGPFSILRAGKSNAPEAA